MKKIILILVILLFSVVSVSAWNPFSNPITPPAFPGVRSDGNSGLVIDGAVTVGSAVTMNSSSVAIPATGVLTAAMHKGGVVLNDSLLSAATDVQLLAVSAEFSFKIFTKVGTYGISLVPPAGEALIRVSVVQTADYEMDLSHAVFDEFTVQRRAYGAGYVYRIIPDIGSASDGGAVD